MDYILSFSKVMISTQKKKNSDELYVHASFKSINIGKRLCRKPSMRQQFKNIQNRPNPQRMRLSNKIKASNMVKTQKVTETKLIRSQSNHNLIHNKGQILPLLSDREFTIISKNSLQHSNQYNQQHQNVQQIKFLYAKLEKETKILKLQLFLKQQQIAMLKTKLKMKEQQFQCRANDCEQVINQLNEIIASDQQQNNAFSQQVFSHVTVKQQSQESTSACKFSELCPISSNLQYNSTISVLNDRIKYQDIEIRMLKRSICQQTKILQVQCAQVKLQNRQLRQQLRNLKQYTHVQNTATTKQQCDDSLSFQFSKQSQKY